MRYIITIEINAEHISSEAMDELVADMVAQVDSLSDGTYEDRIASPKVRDAVVNDNYWRKEEI